MRYLSFSLLLILISCSNGEVRQDINNGAYQTSGLEQFFLPELPAWNNSSASGQCFKKRSFQYLDFAKAGSVYDLKYPELIELQAQYNERLESYFRSTALRFIKPVEEAAFFSNTLENVRAGVKSFKLPQAANKVDLIWLDRYIALKKIDELKKMKFEERPPILFSSCLSKEDMNLWLLENHLDEVGFFTLTAEWLSPYSSELQLRPGLHIEIKKLLNPGTDIRLVTPEEILLPAEIVL